MSRVSAIVDPMTSDKSAASVEKIAANKMHTRHGCDLGEKLTPEKANWAYRGRRLVAMGRAEVLEVPEDCRDAVPTVQ